MALSQRQLAAKAERALTKQFDSLFSQEEQDRMEYAVNNETPDSLQWRFFLDGKEMRMTYHHATKKITYTGIERFSFYSINVYTKGDLEGYADGDITFRYNGTEYNHEFLYRFNDAANGENHKIVSVDHGYHIPFIDEVWDQLEAYLKQHVAQKLSLEGDKQHA